jgi:IclR family pca regulon transcriptional regulator
MAKRTTSGRRTTSLPEGDDREYVQSLERGIRVLQAFDAKYPRLTLSEVAATADLNRATARRLLLTLVRLQLVNTNGKLFWLQPRILDLGFRYLSSLPWWHVAQPVIESLSKEIQEPVSISVFDGNDVTYVARAVINRIVSTNINIGSRFPAFCTAAGRAMLAYLPDNELDKFLSEIEMKKFTERTITDPVKLRELIVAARRKGYATSDQELELSLFGIAVPIIDSSGRAAAAVTVSVHALRQSPAQILKRVLPLLVETAQKITQHLQFQEFQPSGLMVPPGSERKQRGSSKQKASSRLAYAK